MSFSLRRIAPAPARRAAGRLMARLGAGERDDVGRVLRRHLKPNDILYEVGANIGVYTQMAAARCRRVVAFEPNPDLMARLSALHLSNVTLRPEAASDRIGEATLHIDMRPDTPALASSLMELTDLKASGMARPLRVPATTLDAVAEETGLVPDFVKIDVEGHEPSVLRGMRDIIAQRRPVILFEFWESHWDRYRDTFEMLSRTYRLIRIADGADAHSLYTQGRHDGAADILCLPNAAAR